MLEKVYAIDNLNRAFRRVKSHGGSPGVDGQSIQQFEARPEDNLRRLYWELRSGSYQPRPGERVWRDKPGKADKRPLTIPAVRDRLVQTALYQVIGPLFDPDFHEHSYGFRPGRGCLDAIRRVIQLLNHGFVHVLDADIQACFPSIPHEPLLKLVSQKVRDRRVLRLVMMFLKQGVMDDGEIIYPEEGTPQGAVISPLLANIYLNPLDHLVAEAGYEMIRYADDFVILCRSREESVQTLNLVKGWMEKAGLTLHPDKTRTVDERQPGGFDFLGYHFEQGLRVPRSENIQRLKDKLWHQTRRPVRRNPSEVVADVNQVLKGWFQHFSLTNNPQPFQEMDDWVRRRIANLQSLRQERNRPKTNNQITRELYSLTEAFYKSQTVSHIAVGY